MNKGLLGTEVVTQIGIIVKDIESSSRKVADFFGVEVPDWIITDTRDIALTEYQGEASDARAKLAFFHLGQVQLELIEPDEHPSTWREHLELKGEGVHHIAFQIKGMKEKIELLQGQGISLIQKGEYTGGRYAYVDTIPQLNVITELLEND